MHRCVWMYGTQGTCLPYVSLLLSKDSEGEAMPGILVTELTGLENDERVFCPTLPTGADPQAIPSLHGADIYVHRILE